MDTPGAPTWQPLPCLATLTEGTPHPPSLQTGQTQSPWLLLTGHAFRRIHTEAWNFHSIFILTCGRLKEMIAICEFFPFSDQTMRCLGVAVLPHESSHECDGSQPEWLAHSSSMYKN